MSNWGEPTMIVGNSEMIKKYKELLEVDQMASDSKTKMAIQMLEYVLTLYFNDHKETLGEWMFNILLSAYHHAMVVTLSVPAKNSPNIWYHKFSVNASIFYQYGCHQLIYDLIDSNVKHLQKLIIEEKTSAVTTNMPAASSTPGMGFTFTDSQAKYTPPAEDYFTFKFATVGGGESAGSPTYYKSNTKTKPIKKLSKIYAADAGAVEVPKTAAEIMADREKAKTSQGFKVEPTIGEYFTSYGKQVEAATQKWMADELFKESPLLKYLKDHPTKVKGSKIQENLVYNVNAGQGAEPQTEKD